jgi:di/tricarboxylate transporter
MTFDQVAIVSLLLCMFVAYALDRFAVELVAAVGLAAAFGLKLVPVDAVFGGFSNPAVITVIEILLIVSVLARTHAMERLADLIVARAGGERGALAIVCSSGALVSVFMNNIGALALFFPVTLSVCSRLRIPPGRMLMPLSFATLMGGTCSLTGTPANLVVNQWRIAETGGGFGYFALGTVGFPLTIAGLLWLILTAPRLVAHGGGDWTASDPGPGEFLFEGRVPNDSSFVDMTLPNIERIRAVQIHDVLRSDAHVFARREAISIMPGDILLLECSLGQFDALRAQGLLAPTTTGDERLEAVVMPDSVVLGSRLGALGGFARHDVEVLGLASRRHRVEGEFSDLQIGLGDVLILSGERQSLREAVSDASLLPLSARPASHSRPDAYRSIVVFLLGIAATALDLAPPEIAFGGVVIVMALLGSLRLRPALQDVNWTIVILLGCMIPLGAAVQDTGAAHVIANEIVVWLPAPVGFAVTATMLGIAVLITQFADNVSTAAVLAPIAADMATRAGIPVEPLLVAVAIGTSLDFLTPFGHHNNAVVMGAAGYRFRDFPRLGFPLLLVCLAAALAALRLFWL